MPVAYHMNGKSCPDCLPLTLASKYTKFASCFTNAFCDWALCIIIPSGLWMEVLPADWWRFYQETIRETIRRPPADMASRPNPSNKLAEMSRQQELIERRRQEIEQRRRAAAGSGGGRGGQRSATGPDAAAGPSASLSAGSSARRLFEAHKQR